MTTPRDEKSLVQRFLQFWWRRQKNVTLQCLHQNWRNLCTKCFSSRGVVRWLNTFHISHLGGSCIVWCSCSSLFPRSSPCFFGFQGPSLWCSPGWTRRCTSIIFSVTYSKFYALSCAVFGSSIFERFCKNLTNFVRCVLKYSPCKAK